MSETVCTDGWVPDKIRDRVPDCGASNWKGPTAVSVEPTVVIVAKSAWTIALLQNDLVWQHLSTRQRMDGCYRRESNPAIACWGDLDDASMTSRVVGRVTTRLDSVEPGDLGQCVASWQCVRKQSCDVWQRAPWLAVSQSGLLLQCFGHDPAIGCWVSDVGISCGSSWGSGHLRHAGSMSLQRTGGWREQVLCMFGFWWAVTSIGHDISSSRRPWPMKQGQCISWHLIGTDHLKTVHCPDTQSLPHIPPYCHLQ